MGELTGKKIKPKKLRDYNSDAEKAKAKLGDKLKDKSTCHKTKSKRIIPISRRSILQSCNL